MRISRSPKRIPPILSGSRLRAGVTVMPSGTGPSLSVGASVKGGGGKGGGCEYDQTGEATMCERPLLLLVQCTHTRQLCSMQLCSMFSSMAFVKLTKGTPSMIGGGGAFVVSLACSTR